MKIKIESKNDNNKDKNKKGFIRKEVVDQEKNEALEKLYQKKEFAFIQKPPKISVRIIILTIIISIIFGLLAGFFGALFLLARKEIKIPLFKKINFEEILPKREITLFTEKKITVVPEERILELTDRILPKTIRIFFSKKIKKDLSSEALAKEDVLERIYLPEENLGLGVILTDDGWLLSTQDIINRENLSLEISTFGKKNFPIEKIIFDKPSKTTFLKIKTQDLPVIKFADEESLKLGKNLIIFNKFFELDLAQISQKDFFPVKDKKDFIKSSEEFSRFFKINKTLKKDFLGGPVFDLDGAFCGFISSSLDQVIPASYFKNIIRQVLKDGKIKRPFLGLKYIELKDLSFPSENIKNGAFVYEIKEKSPAFFTGFKKGDLILKVNETILNEKNLTEIIQEMDFDQEIEFSILREGREITLKTKLSLLP